MKNLKVHYLKHSVLEEIDSLTLNAHLKNGAENNIPLELVAFFNIKKAFKSWTKIVNEKQNI